MAAVATELLSGYDSRHNSGYSRARSASKPKPPPRQEVPSSSPRNADFPRSASYTYLPHAKDPGYDPSRIVTIKGSFSEDDLIAPKEDLTDDSPPDSSGWTTPDVMEHEPKVPHDLAQDLIAELQKSPKVSVSRLTPDTSTEQSSIESRSRGGSISTQSSRTTSSTVTQSRRVPPRSSFSRKFSGDRKSWYSAPSSPSRSPSPPKRQATIKPHEVGADAAPTPPSVSMARRKSFRRKDSAKAPEDVKDVKPVGEGIVRKATVLRKKAARASMLFKGSSTDDAVGPMVPSVPSIPTSFSTDKLPTVKSLHPNERASPMPRLVSAERVPGSGLNLTRKKDELWSVFRALDGDHTKFQSKSSAFKANVVRSALLPFLRTYANHPSNLTLRPEDLDRRANILNKWWTGLIEMLHGRNNQSISGTDRPAILDGISGIMERPEWRLSPSPFCPLIQRMKGTATPRNRSTTSLSSNASEFLADSVHHNVRNIFIQNLSAQMAFVVDKMSLRNASASLVTFCGKACAYAFMFVPGMADVLVRLWELPMDTLRRVLEENGVGKFENLSDTAARIVSGFPPTMQQLGFTSLTKYMRCLRSPPPLPLGTANIQWWGYWLERWTGRESDLFYVFVKHFHVLVTDFLPPDASKPERMCVPGLLLVHAQILANLDSTIHRDVVQTPQDNASGPSPTFDDVLTDPDAVASTLPLPPTNAVRVMAENRLIMLIRDFLSERAAEHPIARLLFAESFNDLLQAAARKTSIFDHAACYTLCDFLEEALLILVKYEHLKETEGNLIDSTFWMNVCKKMISSQNTMTEIRLYAFLYTVWNTVVCDRGRKADMCLALLLDPEIFESRFNHWCPMVRAYYMRLLCWRVGRYDDEAMNGDVRIYETLLERLRTTWSHYLYLREQAEKTHSVPPPTAPCNPAPSRRILIIRTDTQVAPGGSFLSFEGIVPPTPSASLGPAWKRQSTLSLADVAPRPDSARSSVSDAESPDQEPGIRGFFRGLIRSSKSRSSSQGAVRPTTKQADDPFVKNGIQALARSATTGETQEPRERASVNNPHVAAKSPPTAHRNFCFKFSLEYYPKANQAPPPMRLYPPRLPMPAQLFLQSHSQKANSSAYMRAIEPIGNPRATARYAGRALAEWTVIVGECQSFFERRKGEGVPSNKLVETPTLGVEVFRRPS